jgi:hypothetical protein
LYGAVLPTADAPSTQSINLYNQSAKLNIVSIVEADMLESLLMSWQVIVGVLVVFAVFMAGLFWMERGASSKGRRRAAQNMPQSRVMRVVRCEKQDRAA